MKKKQFSEVKIKVILVLSLLSVAVTMGQNSSMSAEEMAQYQTAEMTKLLDLTEEQQGQVSEINSKYSKRMKALIDREGSMFGKMGDMKAIRKEKNAEIKKVLNEEQFEDYEDEIEPAIRKHMKKNITG